MPESKLVAAIARRELAKLTEKERAIILAHRVLDRVNADPDDDLAVLARQLLRTREMLDRFTRHVKSKVPSEAEGTPLDQLSD